MKTIRKNDSGAAVEDIQKRLRFIGYSLVVDGVFLDRTQAAVKAFREKEGLPEGDYIDDDAWSALVDATFSLGDRMLYLRMPYFHGCDVRSLQRILSALGFVCGDADGIFGGLTESALRDFQSSVGLVDDGVAGPSTFDAVQRLRHAWEGKQAVSAKTQPDMGFARAASALEHMEACFFGMDALGRDVASRAANLAQATMPFSSITSADTLSVQPSDSMLRIGIYVEGELQASGAPIVGFSNDYFFPQRLSTALKAARNSKIFVEITQRPSDIADDARWAQHIAVVLLDALCAAYA